HRRITSEELEVGRVGLLADVDSEGNPYVAVYTAESIVNWADDGSLVILDESTQVLDPETLKWSDVTQYRKLWLENGIYTTALYDADGNIVVAEGQEAVPKQPEARGGKKLDFIPFVFVDSVDLTPSPDEVPLIGLAR